MKNRITKVKNHLKENKAVYISNGITLGVGIGFGVILRSGQTAVVKPLSFNWRTSDTINITQELVRRGHPGYKVLCVNTGEVYASYRRAADACGVSPRSVSDVCNGVRESVKGLKFVKLGEM